MRWRSIQHWLGRFFAAALTVWPLIIVWNTSVPFHRRFVEYETTINAGLFLIVMASVMNGMWRVLVGTGLGMIVGMISVSPLKHDPGNEMVRIAISGSFGTVFGWLLHADGRLRLWRRRPPKSPPAEGVPGCEGRDS